MKFVTLLSCLLCLLGSTSTATADPNAVDSNTVEFLSGPEAAALAVEELALVFDMHCTGDFSPLTDANHFCDVGQDTESHMIAFNSEAFVDATGREMVGVVDPNRALVRLAPSWDQAVPQIKDQLEQAGRIPYELYTGDTSQTLLLRSPDLEFTDHYYILEMTMARDSNDSSILLAYFRQDRTQEVQVFYDPLATWQLDRPSWDVYCANMTLSAQVEAAAGIFGTHRLALQSFGTDGGSMVLTPKLYPDSPPIDPNQRDQGTVRQLLEVRLDDEVLPIESKPAKSWDDPDTFTFELSPETLAQVVQANMIQFDLQTILDEHVELVFSLTDVNEPLARAQVLTDLAAVSPLIADVASQDYEGLEADFALGPEINRALPNGGTALHLATVMQDPKMIRLLDTYPGLNTEVRDANGQSCLDLALELKDPNEVLKALLDIGCNPNAQNAQGQTPLMRTGGHPEIMDMLVHAGAKVTVVDANGCSVLHYLASDITTSEGQVKRLVSYGVDPNAQAQDGNTPLMTAVDHYSLSAINDLLDLKVDLFTENDQGQTARDIAQSYSDADLYSDKVMRVFSPYLSLRAMVSPIQVSMGFENLAKRLELSALYGFGFKNGTDETVWVALRILDDDDDWVTEKWYRLDPGEDGLLARSTNRIFYYYAKSDSYVWEGDDNHVTIDGDRVGMKKRTVERKYRGDIWYIRLK